ncbi:MAG: YceI family protein [Gemmatimonadota bacterium]
MKSAIPVITGALLLAMPGTAFAQASYTSGSVQSGTLSFDGKATMGDFVGTTTTVAGAMTGSAELSSVQGWVEAQVNTLKTGNDRRDRDLNKSMESARYPVIRFDLSSVTPGAISGDSMAVTLHGTFRIHGVDRQVSLPGTLVRQPSGLRLRSDFPMNLTDYKIGGLSKMLGMLKMHPDIIVHVDVTFTQT